MGPIGTLRAMGRAAGFAAWTAGVVNANRLGAIFDEEIGEPEGKRVFVHTWSRGVFPILGIDLTVVGGERPRSLGPFLVVANHRSPLDILVCVNLVGGLVLSHHGVAKIPVIGDAARVTDTIFVDRRDGKSGARAIRQMRTRLKEGRNVIVFPEGTTFRGDEVQPFKRGAFSAARGLAAARVLPIGIAYEPGDEFVDEKLGAYTLRLAARPKTRIWATIGEPAPVPRTPADEAALRDTVQGLVDRSALARDRR